MTVVTGFEPIGRIQAGFDYGNVVERVSLDGAVELGDSRLVVNILRRSAPPRFMITELNHKDRCQIR